MPADDKYKSDHQFQWLEIIDASKFLYFFTNYETTNITINFRRYAKDH
jgi:hypothetical protein